MKYVTWDSVAQRVFVILAPEDGVEYRVDAGNEYGYGRGGAMVDVLLLRRGMAVEMLSAATERLWIAYEGDGSMTLDEALQITRDAGNTELADRYERALARSRKPQ